MARPYRKLACCTSTQAEVIPLLSAPLGRFKESVGQKILSCFLFITAGEISASHTLPAVTLHILPRNEVLELGGSLPVRRLQGDHFDKTDRRMKYRPRRPVFPTVLGDSNRRQPRCEANVEMTSFAPKNINAVAFVQSAFLLLHLSHHRVTLARPSATPSDMCRTST